MNESAAAMFRALFRGRENCYGVHEPERIDPTDDTKKLKGKSYTVKENWGDFVFSEHLSGIKSIGMVPLRMDDNVFFAAIDVDIYPIDPRKYAQFFATYSLPFVCFRSKSGGLHAFVFFKNAASAEKVVTLLNELKLLLGLAKTTETFPKQTTATATSQGNWINLPYYDAERTTRYAYDEDGHPMPFEAAMQRCWELRTSVESLKKAMARLPFCEGPPCIQVLYLNRQVCEKEHNRNIFLFNACTYLKARNPEDYESRLLMISKTLDKPPSDEEIQKTVLKSQKETSYSYQCENPALSAYCHEKLCSQRKYGKGCAYISDVTFGKLVQVLAKTPFYKWTVNGVEMVFKNETELRKQDKFQDYCIRFLKKCPNTLKQDVWINVLNKALANMVVETVSCDEDISEEMLLETQLSEFLFERPLAKTINQVQLGQAYLDTVEDKIYFRVSDFIQYYTKNRVLSGVTLNDVYAKLKDLGGETRKVKNEHTGRSLTVWTLPADALYKEDEKTNTIKTLADKQKEDRAAEKEAAKNARNETTKNSSPIHERLRAAAERNRLLNESNASEVTFETEEDF